MIPKDWKQEHADLIADMDFAFDPRPCIHCGRPEGSHSGTPHQYRVFIPSRRCPGSGEFPSHIGAGLGFFEEAESYWTERDTQYTPQDDPTAACAISGSDLLDETQRFVSRYGLSGDEMRRVFAKYQRTGGREYAPGELSCPITGCMLGKDHNGPCVDRFGEEGTIEMRERNLMLLMEDDPEGFRRRVRELLATERTGK